MIGELSLELHVAPAELLADPELLEAIIGAHNDRARHEAAQAKLSELRGR